MTGVMSDQELRLERRSQVLWDQLMRTERRAEEMARETERLRKIKEEARQMVEAKHPHLFNGRRREEAEEGGEFESLSEGSLANSFLSKDLKEIRDLLGAGGATRRRSRDLHFNAHMANVEREAGVGSSRHSHDGRGGGAGNDAAAAAMWPKNCVPVPLETLKHMMEEIAAAASLSRNNGRPAGGKVVMGEYDVRQEAWMESAEGGGAAGNNSPSNNNDDTSNDAVDLSQENNEKEEEEEKKVQSVVATEVKPSPPPPRAVPRNSLLKAESNQAKEVVVQVHPPLPERREGEGAAAEPPSPPLPSRSPSSSSDPNRRKTDSSREPDENFVIASDADNEKLYSSATSEDDKDDSMSSSEMRVNRPYRPPDPSKTATKVHEEKEEAVQSSPVKRRPRGDHESSSSDSPKQSSIKKKNPLAKYALLARQESTGKTGRINVDSDSDSPAAAGNGGGGIESGVSGPSELDDDDFWN